MINVYAKVVDQNKKVEMSKFPSLSDEKDIH
jgi:hypothetical protein